MPDQFQILDGNTSPTVVVTDSGATVEIQSVGPPGPRGDTLVSQPDGTITANLSGSANAPSGHTASEIKSLLAISESDVVSLTSDLSNLTSAVNARSLPLIPTVVKTANYSAAVNDFIPVDCTSGSVTIALPATPVDKATIAVQLVGVSGANICTINAAGSDVFNKAGGSTSSILKIANQNDTFQYNAAAGVWYTRSGRTPLSQLDTRYPLLDSTTQVAYVNMKQEKYRNKTILAPYWTNLLNGTGTTLFMGDSITYSAATSWIQSYPEIFNAKMFPRYGGKAQTSVLAGGNGLGGNDAGHNIVMAGSPTNEFNGLGAASIRFTATGQSETFTAPAVCTRVKVWYKKGPACGNIKITLDPAGANVVTTIDCYAASVSWGNIWDSGTLASAAHVVKVEAATGGSINAGYNASVEAVEWDPQTAPKIFVAGRSGNASLNFTQASNPGWDGGLNALDPRLVIAHLGTNDLGASVSATTFQANMQEWITRMNSLPSGAPAIILCKLPKNSTQNTDALMQPYWTAIDNLVAANSNCISLDLQEAMGQSNINTGGLFFGGGVHPTIFGTTVLADTLAKLVFPPAYDYYTAPSTIAGQSDYTDPGGSSSIAGDVMLAPNGFATKFTRLVTGALKTTLVSNISGFAAPAWVTLDPTYMPPRVIAMTDGATITPAGDTTDIGTVTLAGNRTMAAPTGTPINGQILEFRIKQDATGSRTMTWNSIYRFSTDIPSPTLTTTINKTDRIWFEYNLADTKWDCIRIVKGY